MSDNYRGPERRQRLRRRADLAAAWQRAQDLALADDFMSLAALRSEAPMRRF